MFAIWRACERVGIRPPNVKECWQECDINTQALLLAYQQVREYEEFEVLKMKMKSSF